MVVFSSMGRVLLQHFVPSSIGIVPFKVVYGRDPPPHLRHSSLEDTPLDVHKQLEQRDELLQVFKGNLLQAQHRMKLYADKKRRDVAFHVDDWALVKLQPYSQHSVHLHKFQKLAMQYFGPFKVVECIGKVAYRLAIPDHAQIHPVFHVSILKRFLGSDPSQTYMTLSLLSIREGPMCQPLEILGTRLLQHGDIWETQCLVHWDGSSADAWEWLSDLRALYPNLNLEDKVLFEEGNNVMTDHEMGPSGDKEAQEKGDPRCRVRMRRHGSYVKSRKEQLHKDKHR